MTTKIENTPWVKDAVKRGFPVPEESGREIKADQIRGSGGCLVHVVRYRSLDHILSVVNEAMPIEKCYGARDMPDDASEHWTYGDLGQEESYKAMTEGRSPSEKSRKIYEEVRNEVQARILGGEVSRCRSARRKRRNAWAGGSINVPQYLATRDSGPAPCFRTMSRRADRPVVRIGINVSMSCGNAEIAWFKLAANAAAMSEAFENLGYGVEIVGLSCALKCEDRSRSIDPQGKKCESYTDFWYSIGWDLKSADDPLDIERIMSIGQPCLLRDVMFRAGIVTCGKTPGAQCLDTPDDVVKASNVDILLEKTWGRGGATENADRIVGKIKELLGEQ
jgi:hypothetical protein